MNKQQVEGRPQKKSDGAHQQSADLSSPVLAAFKVFQKELDTKHDKHERLVKLSRDVTIESKRTIFLLHRVTSVPDVEVVLNEADGKLDGVRQKIGQIAEELKGEDIFQFHRAFTAGIQEYVEAASFQHYIRHRSLISLEQINASLVFMTGDKSFIGLHDGRGVSASASQYEVPAVLGSNAGSGTFCVEFACSPRECVGSPPASTHFQKHAPGDRLIGNTNLAPSV
ncbi:translin-associated protein X isoform X2 [Nerophis ophidion]|uniref:translin-associated protein X isoform X2 n=1 Tax=Nerophis ophidion TaxID=159077 RepID=UPI002ADF1C19|nr:translin-associated protein X isoform X2 [Nerophis ophidion]